MIFTIIDNLHNSLRCKMVSADEDTISGNFVEVSRPTDVCSFVKTVEECDKFKSVKNIGSADIAITKYLPNKTFLYDICACSKGTLHIKPFEVLKKIMWQAVLSQEIFQLGQSKFYCSRNRFYGDLIILPLRRCRYVM